MYPTFILPDEIMVKPKLKLGRNTQALDSLRRHASKRKALHVKSPKLGELKHMFHEMEYEAYNNSEALATLYTLRKK